MSDVNQNQPAPVGGPADDTSVREFTNRVAEMARQVMSRDFFGALRTGGSIFSVAADLFGLGNVFGATPEDSEAVECHLKEAEQDCEECRKALQGPQPVGADPKAIDPATILMLVELVFKLIEAIRKRRNPNP